MKKFVNLLMTVVLAAVVVFGVDVTAKAAETRYDITFTYTNGQLGPAETKLENVRINTAEASLTYDQIIAIVNQVENATYTASNISRIGIPVQNRPYLDNDEFDKKLTVVQFFNDPQDQLSFNVWLNNPDLISPIYVTFVVHPAPATPAPQNSAEPEKTEEPVDNSEPEPDYLEGLRTTLTDAIALGGKQTIYWNEGNALPYEIMVILQENPDVTLVFNYTYEYVEYRITLVGKNVKADPEGPWCGPLYLYKYYGDKDSIVKK